MNAKEIEIQRGGEEERRDPFFAEAALPEFDHLRHRFPRLFRGNSFETNTAAAIGVSLDDVHILLLVEAGIPNFAAGKLVQLFDSGLGDRQLYAALVNEFQ